MRPCLVCACVCCFCGVCVAVYDEDSKILFTTSRGVAAFKDFDTMGLPEDLVRGIYAYGAQARAAAACVRRWRSPGSLDARVVAPSRVGAGSPRVWLLPCVCVRAGFDKPSAIQQRAIVPIIKGKDLIAQSQSGTGKTAVFSIGTLASLDLKSKDLQALVLSPTRELATQSQKVIKAIGDHMNVRCHVCIGGKSIGDDIRQL